MAIDWDKAVLAPVMAVFGEAVTYRPAGGSPFAMHGVFDEAYHSVSLTENGQSITTEMPVLGVRLADFAGHNPPKQGDKLSVRGGVYVVKDVHLDGHGHAKLMLNYVSAA